MVNSVDDTRNEELRVRHGNTKTLYRNIKALRSIIDSLEQEVTPKDIAKDELDRNELNTLSPAFEGWDNSVGVRIGDRIACLGWRLRCLLSNE